LRKLSDKEVLERIPIKQIGWVDKDVFLWFARRIEAEILERMKTTETLKQLATYHGYKDIKHAARLIGRTPRTLLTWYKDPDKRANMLEPLLKAYSPLNKEVGKL